jgi:hypothetical protein
MTAGTIAAWVDALTFGRHWDQDRDALRIQQAFRRLAASRTEWPAPSDLLEAMPSSDQPKLSNKPILPATREEREANLERLRQLYGDVI